MQGSGQCYELGLNEEVPYVCAGGMGTFLFLVSIERSSPHTQLCIVPGA